MINKVVLAAIFATSASFATWNVFPVQDAGKGEVQLDFANYWLPDVGGMGMASLGVRYTLVNHLELALSLPYVPYEFDENGNFHSFADGVGNLTGMVRYQFHPNFNGFLDVTFPVGNENLVGTDGSFLFCFGGQYSQQFGMVNFGSQLGLALETYGEDEVTPPWKLIAVTEADFVLGGMFTPYINLGFSMQIGRYTLKDGGFTGSHTGYFNLLPSVGVNMDLTQSFSMSAEIGLETGWHGDGILDPLYHVGLKASYKF